MITARSQAQTAADAGALAGVRMLDGNSGNNYAAAKAAAEGATKANSVLSQPLDVDSATVTAHIGSYTYDKNYDNGTGVAKGRFIHQRDSKPANENYSAVQVELTTEHPLFFARPLGFDVFSTTVRATAVHRPRDIAIVLDFSGSMAFGSWFHKPLFGNVTGSLNPDPDVPNFGPWSVIQSRLRATTGYDAGTTGYLSLNNFTMDSPQNGPAIVKDFLYDPANVNDPTQLADPVDYSNLRNAFWSQTNPNTTWDPNADVAQPAPSNFKDQTDSPITYRGDRWPRLNQSFTTGAYAKTAMEFLTGSNGADTGTGSALTTTLRNDWQTNGYDRAGNTFQGYSMGPGYYGKTFWMWPPDPRPQHDWRRKFFNTNDNTALFESNGAWRGSGAPTPNYAAILDWIKNTGPKVFPPNLRAGRVVYYKSIPNDISGWGGSSESARDKTFWKNYIDYVLGRVSSPAQTLYGVETAGPWNGAIAASITAPPTDGRYMDYNDVPRHPRLHFWFGPLSMLGFVTGSSNFNYGDGTTTGRNWLPGTCHESQCWQVKAGINSALSDIEKNHPNDWVSLIYFSGFLSSTSPAFDSARVQLGRDYSVMKNVLFFPYSLRNNLGDGTREIRPYDDTMSLTAPGIRSWLGEIPNGWGGTTPEMGLKIAYNEFSGASGYNGRKGAAKLVIFETDGVPGITGNGTFNNNGPHRSYYSGIGRGSSLGYNNATVVSNLEAICKRITASDSSASDPDYPGYSGATTARVHCIGFGDLFESSAAAKNDALSTLLKMQKAGKTSKVSDTSIESYKIITGDYQDRIDKLREAFERILQSGVQVSLVKGQGED
jgi:hypothetical protein